MSNATCCLPVVLPTRLPWHQRLVDTLREAVLAAWADARASSERRACRAALRHLPPSTLRDIGLAHLVRDDATLPRVDWEHGRWR